MAGSAIPSARFLEAGVEYVLTAGSALRDAEGGTFRGQDLRFNAEPAVAPAEVESVTETQWDGSRAIRVRFTGAVSPLGGRGFRLQTNGTVLESETRMSTDGREALVIPRAQETRRSLTLLVENIADAGGRRVPDRQVIVDLPSAPK